MPWQPTPAIRSWLETNWKKLDSEDDNDWNGRINTKQAGENIKQFGERKVEWEKWRTAVKSGSTLGFLQWFDQQAQAQPQQAAPTQASGPPPKPTELKPGPIPAVAGQAFPQFSGNVVKTDIRTDIAVAHEGQAKKRLKLHFHVLPIHDTWITRDELKKTIRKRALKWVRRVFAQANIGLPVKADIQIEDVDPGPDTTLSICGTLYDTDYKVCHRPSGLAKDGTVITGNSGLSVEGSNYKVTGASWAKNPSAGAYIMVSGCATGGNNGRKKVVSATNDTIQVDGSLTNEAAGASISIALCSEAIIKVKPAGQSEEIVRVPLEKDQTFLAIAQAIQQALDRAGFDVTAPTTHLSDEQHETSHDLVIQRKKGGTAIESISASHDDSELGSWWRLDLTAGTKVELASDKRDPKAVFEVPSLKDIGGEDGFHGGCPRQRRLLRLGTSDEGRIDIFVAPKGGINGRAYPIYGEIQESTGRKPAPPLRNAAYVVFNSTGSKGIVFGKLLDVSPFTLPHEIGHVLGDTGHNVAEGDLMHGGWSKDNSATANKRIYGKTLLVGSLDFLTEKPKPNQDMQKDMHQRNAGILEDW